MRARACQDVTRPSTVMLVMTAHWNVPKMSMARATTMPISPGLSSVRRERESKGVLSDLSDVKAAGRKRSTAVVGSIGN